MRSYQRSFEMKSVLQLLMASRWLVMICALPLLVTMHIARAQTTESGPANFDHIKTGFNLSGTHAQARCGSCHTQGIFKGTPRDCAGCHMVGNRMGAMAKPGNHISTFAPCDSCHRTTAWSPASFSHVGVAPGTCTSCHNGSMAPGKPGGHVVTTASCDNCHRNTSWIPAGFNHMGVAPGTCSTCHNGSTATGKSSGHTITTASCDSCHRTSGWIPASFNHTGVAPGTCSTCHNGTSATGKPSGHVITTASCDSCHRTSAWIPATFSHTGVAPGTCSTCHNGTSATGKPSGHIITTTSCDSCHRTSAWIPATFAHTSVAPGTCSTCHNGTSATGKSSSHFATTRSCDACHTTTGWTPLKAYSHISTAFKRHSSAVACIGCHTSNSELIPWNMTYKPDCAGCHAGDFKADSHKKTEVPNLILYTVDNLRDCAGSCHLYANGTILQNRTGQHKSTDGGF